MTAVHGSQIVTAARGWIGTPYHHQAATCGAGSDCLGLIRGIWREVYGAEPETPPPYTADWSEPQGEERLWAAAMRHLSPVIDTQWRPGRVLLFRMRRGAVAKHLGISSEIAGAPAFIHAYSGQGVVESPLSAPWRKRVVAQFQFPHLKG